METIKIGHRKINWRKYTDKNQRQRKIQAFLSFSFTAYNVEKHDKINTNIYNDKSVFCLDEEFSSNHSFAC